MTDQVFENELIKKYRWAGEIRLVSFLLLFVFLVLMKAAGGYSYLNISFAALIFVEIVLNQPYPFLLRRVHLQRFQYYQMIIDIIAISWIVYYMGGIEAPVVTIAYYAVILWAGFVSGPQAVFFAVTCSCLLFSAIVLLGHTGVLPRVSFLSVPMPVAHVWSLLLGHVSFFLAFGYFSAHSSLIVKSLQKKRLEESLKYAHRLSATGYLLNSIAHDIINHLATIRGYAKILSMQIKDAEGPAKKYDSARMLRQIEELESKNIDLLAGLWKFSKGKVEERHPIDMNEAVEDAIRLTTPLTRMSGVVMDRDFQRDLPPVSADKDQIQEALVTLILNLLGTLSRRDGVVVRTQHLAEKNSIRIVFGGTGAGNAQEAEGEPEDSVLSFDVAEEIIARHGGTVQRQMPPDRAASIIVELPAVR